MALQTKVLCVVLCVILQQRAEAISQPRPSFSPAGNATNPDKELLDAGKCTSDHANLLMVVQNPTALHCADPSTVIPDNKPFWTMRHFFASCPDPSNSKAWAQHCKTKTKPSLSPDPDHQQIVDSYKYWPDLYHTEDGEPSEENAVEYWHNEGVCVTKYEKYQKIDSVTDSTCYFQQVYDLFVTGLLDGPDAQSQRISMSTFVDRSLQPIFTGVKVVKHEDFTPELVREHFKLNEKEYNVFLGCQTLDDNPDMCVITRVGLCLTCSLDSEKRHQCTPPKYRLNTFIAPTLPDAPGILYDCPTQPDTIQWNTAKREGEGNDVSCYSNQCPSIVYFTPDTSDCDRLH